MSGKRRKRMIHTFGVQLYTVRDYMKDEEFFDLTLKKMAAMGYTEAHTATFFTPIERAKALLDKHGFTVVGTHYNLNNILNNHEETIRYHEILGTKNIGIGGMFGDLSTPAAVRHFIGDYNRAAEYYAKFGYKLTYHNHWFEFHRVDGNKTVMDLLADELDPKNVTFVLDTCWVAYAGADVRYWMEKLSGRIDILHLKDLRACPDPENRMGVNKISEIGNGNLYWDGIMETAEKIGVKSYIVEQDHTFATGSPFDSLKTSADYLRKYMK